MEHYLSLAVKSIFVENILLSFFLGMCSYLAISKKIEPSIDIQPIYQLIILLGTLFIRLLKMSFISEGTLFNVRVFSCE